MLEDIEDEVYTDMEIMHRLEIDIYKRVGGCAGEIKLLLKTMKSAVEKNDRKYFSGPTFKWHCDLLGLDYNFLSKYLKTKDLKKSRQISDYIPEIKQKYLEGKSISKLAKEYNSSKYKISDIVKSIKKIKQQPSELNIIHDRMSGLTYRELAKKYNVSHGTLLKIIKET